MFRVPRGFTLIEMTLVVGVLAILAALIIPRFKNVTDQALEVSRDHQAGIINTKIYEYYVEFGFYPRNMNRGGWRGDGDGVTRSPDIARGFWPDTDGFPPSPPDGVDWVTTRHRHSETNVWQVTSVE